jgi:hypothetical protein
VAASGHHGLEAKLFVVCNTTDLRGSATVPLLESFLAIKKPTACHLNWREEYSSLFFTCSAPPKWFFHNWEVHLSLSCGGDCLEIRTAAHVSGTISEQSIY